MSDSGVTYGLFYANLQFPSEEKFQEWKESVLDFYLPESKKALSPISEIWMGDYPRTSLVGESIGFLSNETFSFEQAFEHFNKTSNFKISQKKIVKMDVSKEGDETYYNFILKGELDSPLKIEDFLQYLHGRFLANEEYFDIQYQEKSIEISAYLGSYEAIEDYTEMLFLMLVEASKFQGVGQGFLIPDNYYYDFYDFISFYLYPDSHFDLKSDDLQNMNEDFAQDAEKTSITIKESYNKWLVHS